jgi:hypothetical protein
VNACFRFASFVLVSTLAGCASRMPPPKLAEPSTLSGAPTLVGWNDGEAFARLERASAREDFFPLANNFESQINKFYCGPTSAVILLNALRGSAPAATKPLDPALFAGSRGHLPPNYEPVFARYTQNAFFTPQTDRVKTREEVFGKPKPGTDVKDYGIQLHQLAAMLEAHGLVATVREVDDKADEAKMANEIIANLGVAGDFVLVNYSRKAMGQEGGGHITPLGAYDRRTDSFLVMDVNPNVAPWVWVNAKDLFAAMRTKDGPHYRGYILVREGQPK